MDRMRNEVNRKALNQKETRKTFMQDKLNIFPGLIALFQAKNKKIFSQAKKIFFPR